MFSFFGFCFIFYYISQFNIFLDLCSIASVKNNNKCSQCDSIVDENNMRYKEYLKTLKFLFPYEEETTNKEDESELDLTEMDIDIAEGNIKVTTLSGEFASFSYQPTKKILILKNEIEAEFKTPPNKQRLLYQDKELKIKDENNKELTLEDFNIPSDSTLQLIVILYEVSDDLDELVFDFCWGLPKRNQRDYLDVSVFVYGGKSYVGTIYWRNRSIDNCPGVTHSGPADMDFGKNQGHHRVDISLKSVPQYIDKIVFTLSAWRSSSVSAYGFRRLRFYDVDFPDKELCSDDIYGLSHNESIIMCCLFKKRGKWTVLSLKCGADGCTKDFAPLREKIQELIQRKTIP